MPKRPLKLRFRIPPYASSDRNAWRRQIYAAALAKQGYVKYEPTDQLEVEVGLYFKVGVLNWHDVDNRLKDVLDALQGRAGGSKAVHDLEPIIPNDRQIYRVVVEKREPPWQSLGYGHVTIRRLALDRRGAPYNSRLHPTARSARGG